MKHKKIIFITVLSIFVILWVVGIYFLSDMNTNNSNSKSSSFISLFIEDTLKVTNKLDITSSNPSDKKLLHASILLNKPLRKVMHASVYFVLGFIIILIINILFNNKQYLLSLIITMLITGILASLDEYHQTMVPGRTGQVMDVIIDNVGALVGCLFYTTYYVVYLLGKKKKVK